MGTSLQEIENAILDCATSTANAREAMATRMCRNRYFGNNFSTAQESSCSGICANCAAHIGIKGALNYIIEKSIILKEYDDLIRKLVTYACRDENCRKCKFHNNEEETACAISRLQNKCIAAGNTAEAKEKFVFSVVELLSAKS